MSNKNPQNQFVKGDIRINRKGRPKTFDAARQLAQQIAHETAKIKGTDGKEVEVVVDDHYVTVAEAILRSWATSNDPKLSTAFMEWSFGKVPNKLDVTSGGGKLAAYTVLANPDQWDAAGSEDPVDSGDDDAGDDDDQGDSENGDEDD